MSDTQTPNDPEWLKVGARVATMRSRDPRGLTFATVERLTKRDIVLDDGQRFNRGRRRRDEGGSWGWSVDVMAVDDPVVVAEQISERRRRAWQKARTACDDWATGKGTAFDAILALAPFTGVADQILALDAPSEVSW